MEGNKGGGRNEEAKEKRKEKLMDSNNYKRIQTA